MTTRKRIFSAEREMYAFWSWSAGQRMVTTDGNSVLVIYPGIRADSRGPDYKNAVVSFNCDAPTRGDVELHLDSRDWHRHGHDADPSYDGVVLHVVGSDGGARSHSSARSSSAPVSVVSGQGVLPLLTALPCGFVSRNEETIRHTLVGAGLMRLFGRARRLAADFSSEGPWYSLVPRIARALGYSANSDMAESLGRRLVQAEVRTVLLRCDEEERRAVILGLAGLLPSQRRCAGLPVGGDAPVYEAHWQAACPGASPLDSQGWRLSGLYPNNSPVRRVVALADLWPLMDELALEAFRVVLNIADGPRSCAAELEQLIRRQGSSYWRMHSDFGLVTRQSDVIGAGKAREVVVNAVLPWVAALAVRRRDPSLLQSVVTLFSSYPAAPLNTVTRHMQRQCNLQSPPPTSAVQQGLLHLFNSYCRSGRCAECPLGRC